MAVASAVTVAATSATLLSVAQQTPRTGVVLSVPAGGVTVFVGGPSVTAAAGFPVAAGSSLSVDLDNYEQLFGIVATGSQAVNVLQVQA